MVQPEIIRNTYSLCPICLNRIPAQHVLIGKEVFLRKNCPQHGDFSTVIWRGFSPISQWRGNVKEIEYGENENCPKACGLCPDHKQDTCCVLLEVTKRCNINCKFCFAQSKDTADPPFKQVKEWLNQLVVPRKTLVQLSGGEPTVRDDLPQIISAAKEAGCKYVQLNSNGIRLAKDKDYVKALSEEGLSFVFMQFDGTNDEIYKELRGMNLLDIKKQAIENCADYNIGVTLVPTLVPGVNTQNIGKIINYAISMSPAVRGVHFQPVSYFGRIPEKPQDEKRITLDELVNEIELQTKGSIKMENLLPSRCDHPLCGFHGDFIVMPDGIKAITIQDENKIGCCSDSESEMVSADKNRAFVARRWERQKNTEESCTCSCNEPDIQNIDYFLQRVKSHGFTVTAMAFQDAWNIDLERLRRCSLHVFDKGKHVPFCAYYISECENKL